MSFSAITELLVALDFGSVKYSVGKLVAHSNKIYFEYADSFIMRGLEISPLRLPLKSGLETFDRFLFDGLPGVFNDSLPDGWGRLLLDRAIRTRGILPEQLTPLDRLAHVGCNGMGALVYQPDRSELNKKGTVNLDELAHHTREILSGASEEVIHELLLLNGSSAGARPKAMIGLDSNRKRIVHGVSKLPEQYEAWLVKFPNSQDSSDAGAIEYVYAQMAQEAGVLISDHCLLPARSGAGYFAAKRFDRARGEKLHVHSVCGLLHSDFRIPSLDYKDLLTLSEVLTNDRREVEKMYRQAVFNVLAHNRDDHAKNFSFLINKKGEWELSPAYDLTFSAGPGAEQSTTVLGDGKNPTIEHLRQLGKYTKLGDKRVNDIINQTRHALAQWRNLATNVGVSDSNVKLIETRIKQLGMVSN